MTDAAPAALATLPPALPPAGLAPVGRGQGLGEGLPADRVAGAKPGQESDPFALILMGFLGASLAATAPQPGAAPALPGTGNGTSPGVGSSTGGPLPGASPLPGIPPLPGAAAGLAAPGAAGQPLPVPGDGLPVGETPTPGPADSAPAAGNAPDEPGTTASDAAGARPGPDTPAVGEANGLAARRAAAMDTLLAEVALGRAALRSAPPAVPGTRGPDPDMEVGSTVDSPPVANDLTASLPAGFSLAGAPAVAQGTSSPSAAALLADSLAGSLAGNLAAGERSGGPGTAAAPGRATLSPLGDGASFATGLGERLVAMGQDGLQTARLRLHPDSLGALDVRIRVDAGQAEVWFGTGQAEARDAIEGTLPRLREMFAAQGIELGRVQVELRPEPGATPGWQAGSHLGPGDQRHPGRSPETGGEPAPTPGRPPWATAAAAATTPQGRQRLLDVLA
jgi:flagellar hook-length control protein FliK